MNPSAGHLGMLAVLLGILLGGGCASCQTDKKIDKEKQMDTLPLCETASDIKRLDGQTARVVGVYRKIMTIRKKGGGEGSFLGFIAIEVNGKPSDYDPSAWDGQPAMIDLGLDVRSAEESARFADKRVVVEGTLMLDPSSVDGSGPGARTKPKPALVGPRNLRLAD